MRNATLARNAMHGIMRKNRIGVCRPTQPQGMRGYLVKQQRGHGIGRLGHRNVVEPPAVRLPGDAGRQAKADQHGGLPRHGSQAQALAGPVVGGSCTRKRFQRGPVGTVVHRDLHRARISAQDVVLVLKRQHGGNSRTKIQRHCKTQRSVDGIGIQLARGIGPGIIALIGALPGERPVAIGGPVGATRLASVQEGIVHARRERDADFTAFGMQPLIGYRHNTIIERGLRGSGDVRESGCARIRLPREHGVSPIKVRGSRPVDPVGCHRGSRAWFPR